MKVPDSTEAHLPRSLETIHRNVAGCALSKWHCWDCRPLCVNTSCLVWWLQEAFATSPKLEERSHVICLLSHPPSQQMLEFSSSTKPSTPGSWQPTFIEHQAPIEDQASRAISYPHKNPASLSPFTDEKSETKFGKGTCPWSHPWSVVEPGLETSAV